MGARHVARALAQVMPAPMHCQSHIDGDCLSVSMVNDAASVAAGQAALRAFLSSHAVSASVALQTELAFEELAVNALRHAYAGRAASQCPIEAWLRVGEHEIVLTIEDRGLSFDPVQATPAPLPSSLEQARPGGLGIRFVRAAATRMAHERLADKNRTTVWLTH